MFYSLIPDGEPSAEINASSSYNDLQLCTFIVCSPELKGVLKIFILNTNEEYLWKPNLIYTGSHLIINRKFVKYNILW